MPEDTNPAGQGAPAAQSTSAQQPPAAPPSGASAEPPKEDPSWLNGRIEQAKRSASAELLKSLGVDSVDAARAKIEAAKKLEDEKKSEIERANERVKALEPEAQRAKELAAVVAERAENELASLTDAQRETVKGLAGDDPAAQLRTIDRLRKGGLLTVPSAAPNASAPAKPTPVAPPASTTGASGAPTPASPTAPNHKAVLSELEKTNPIAAAAYALKNARAIYGDGTTTNE